MGTNLTFLSGLSGGAQGAGSALSAILALKAAQQERQDRLEERNLERRRLDDERTYQHRRDESEDKRRATETQYQHGRDTLGDSHWSAEYALRKAGEAGQTRSQIAAAANTANAIYDDKARAFKTAYPLAPTSDTSPEMATYVKPTTAGGYGVDTTGIGSARRELTQLGGVRDQLSRLQLSSIPGVKLPPATGGTGGGGPSADQDSAYQKLIAISKVPGLDPAVLARAQAAYYRQTGRQPTKGFTPPR